ncbi:MAG TPA: beta-ketoacyl-[acyl-carrier-protein] synthase family protein [Thermoanaerobaculia bacterium]|nr:beta-ketoacyl-[acyl-carrier-protein] synthase family protein [Thermoanaerobaculia bacterium]
MTAAGRTRVVVTGLGAVSGWGAGVDALWRGLSSGRTALRPVERFATGRHRTTIGAEVPAEAVADGAADRRLSLADRFALAAAGEALAEAGLAADELADAGVFFGSSTGGMWESERFYARLIGSEPGRPRLAAITSQQYNGPGDAVARQLGVGGPVETLSSACTSGALAIAAALDALQGGEVELALAGGSDSLCELTYAGFNALRAVDPRPCRPFRADRAGMSLGEGAAVLVLETAAHAARRGARPLAELLAGASTCDAHHMTAPAPDGDGAARAIRQALAEGGLGAEAVGFVDAHGTGTPLNDAAEWQALSQVFAERAGELPLTAPKGAVGHLLGAAGALEAVATVACLRQGVVHPTAGAGPADPEMGARLVLGGPLPCPAAAGLSINLAFGGSNAALLFARWEPAA